MLVKFQMNGFQWLPGGFVNAMWSKLDTTTSQPPIVFKPLREKYSLKNAARASASFMSQRVHIMNEVILHKLLSGQASAAEKAGFENWISENPAHKACFETIKLIWTLAGSDSSRQIGPDANAGWLNFQRKMTAIQRNGLQHNQEATRVSMHSNTKALTKSPMNNKKVFAASFEVAGR